VARRRGSDVGAQLGEGTIGQIRCESFDDHVAVIEQRVRDRIRWNIHTHDGHSSTLVSHTLMCSPDGQLVNEAVSLGAGSLPGSSV
jgi:hypothetical protein